MAHTLASKKSIRQTEKNTLFNKSKISRIKTEKKKFLALVESDKEKAQEAFRITQSLIAKAAKKKVFHWKKASRLISRMAAKLNKAA